jgi:hypothetical protein
MHAGRLFSRIVQVDPALGQVANETLENQEYMRDHETEVKSGH